MQTKKITRQEVENWLGDDDVVQILTLIANGEYTANLLKQDILEYNDGQ